MNELQLADNPTPTLDQLAEFIRHTYPECRRAFADFNRKRFQIGFAMIVARGILSNGNKGQIKNPVGKNQHEDKLDTVSILTTSNPHANFNGESAGLMVWAKKEFPDIAYRTLARYREWAENQALPKLLESVKQLELPGQPTPSIFLSLPEGKIDEIDSLLAECVNGKDLTLSLRAMNAIPDAEDPTDNLRPRKKGDKSKREAVKEKLAKLKADCWASGLKKLLENFLKKEEPIWLDISRERQDELKELLKLGHDTMVAVEKRRK